MNIIRTKAVELTSIPAIAYKQKLSTGGAGIRILMLGSDAVGVATIDKRTGEAVPYGPIDTDIFTPEAFEEALELVAGLPYSARGKITIAPREQAEPEDVAAAADSGAEKLNMIDSDEYKMIVERYSDEKGKMNYALMNKDFIQFAAKSKLVADMVGSKASTDDIIVHIIKNRAAYVAGKKESLDDDSTRSLIETLDEIDPRSAFKELKLSINRMLAKVK